MNNTTIAIIGGGNMGSSLIGGLIADGYSSDHLWVAEPSETKRHQLAHQFSIHVTDNNALAIDAADIVIFAVKPQAFMPIATSLASHIQTRKPLVISIAAGIREKSLQQWLGGNVAIVRSMPNTPALIGCGASALYANTYVTPEQHKAAESILRAVGIIVWLTDENLMDAVTALSGSGPAYFFLMMEALADAAVTLGLPQDIARLLTAQTALGAARMALQSDEIVATLRERVTSPGGTTEAGLAILEKAHIRDVLKNTLQAATDRAKALAHSLGET